VDGLDDGIEPGKLAPGDERERRADHDVVVVDVGKVEPSEPPQRPLRGDWWPRGGPRPVAAASASSEMIGRGDRMASRARWRQAT
jgi:hypothetical protein